MQEFTIGEVARQAGLQPSAIRYYESVGLLPPPKRVNGRRRYDADIFKRLGLIQLIRQAGFGIGELQVLFTAFSADASDSTDWQPLAAAKIAEMDVQIKRAQAVKSWLTEALAGDCTQQGDCLTVTPDESGEGLHVSAYFGELNY
jgi:MerR family redox-sensitive transcriptional activator SoxR